MSTMLRLREPYTLSLDDRGVDQKKLVYFWTGIGAVVLLVGGIPLFIAWLTPGLPPPGPFG